MRKSVLIFLLAWPFGAGAKLPHKTPKAKPLPIFEQTLKKYQKAKVVSMKVEKSVKSQLLDKETIYQGEIQLSRGKFRWENELPEKTLLLFDGQTLMNVQYPPKDFGGPIQVAKSKLDTKTRKQILISSLLSPATAKSNFKIIKETRTGTRLEFQIQPDSQDLQIKDLLVVINGKSKRIDEISYQDDVGNITKMTFRDVKFLNKVDSKIFEYKIPPKAQVTNL